jgi:hypothetical protein
MPHYSDYKCSVCKRPTERILLVAKKAVFSPLGPGAKTIKSRTLAWLCDECLPKDEDFQREAHSGAPGLKSPALERVRALDNKSGNHS